MVEGAKSVLELAGSSFEITHLLVTSSFWDVNEKKLEMLADKVQVVSERQLTAISSLQSNQDALAVAKMATPQEFSMDSSEMIIALDRIRDPGNFGTILRVADWYGITKIICSTDCAEFYNPKVIQASMGSFTRVQVYPVHLSDILPQLPNVYAATMQGVNVHTVKFASAGVLLIGNEAKGLSSELESLAHQKISIPGYGGAESLNAAVATAVICDNWKRCQT